MNCRYGNANHCRLSSDVRGSTSWKFPGNKNCRNDKMTGLVIQKADKGAKIIICDNSSCKTSDDYTVVTVKQNIPWTTYVHIEGAEDCTKREGCSYSNEYVDVVYHRDGKGGKLKKNVSMIKVE